MVFVLGLDNVIGMPFVCLPSGNASKKTEVAVYLMGQLHESLSIPYETVVKILAQTVQNSQQAVTVRLRSLWLLERVANDYSV